ncbi:hypothetical protein TSUD_141260 [Trifolium subterraneum]|uniref:Uncharacterized protein n=1 Tax=Trifolium subterraneum TaxID=3900 RepID=A0A2Z6NPY4_TRISU|nr:hypothetical protein TSUD_141260 [Trifolium subterraneum]
MAKLLVMYTLRDPTLAKNKATCVGGDSDLENNTPQGQDLPQTPPPVNNEGDTHLDGVHML